MAELTNTTLDMKGHLGDLTLYRRNGKTFVRPAHIRQPRRLSRKQLMQREQLSHNNTLWRRLKMSKRVYFEGEKGAYCRFMSVNKMSPVVYLTKEENASRVGLLLPEMVISDGPRPSIGYRLGNVGGEAALLVDLCKEEVGKGELLLYVLRQELVRHSRYGELPQLSIKVETVGIEDVVEVEGGIAMTGERFADAMAGFGLVQVIDGQVGRQRVVTRCTYYERYTTEEALEAAAKSYGGLT